MANIFQIKRRLAGGSSSMTGVSLAAGELAFNEVNNIFYYGSSSNSKDPIGGQGYFTTLDTAQTIDGDKTFQGALNLGTAAVVATASTSDSSNVVANTEFVHNVAAVLDGGSF